MRMDAGSCKSWRLWAEMKNQVFCAQNTSCRRDIYIYNSKIDGIVGTVST